MPLFFLDYHMYYMYVRHIIRLNFPIDAIAKVRNVIRVFLYINMPLWRHALALAFAPCKP